MKAPSPTSFTAKADRARYAIKVLIEVMADDKRRRQAYIDDTAKSNLEAAISMEFNAAASHKAFSYVLGQLRSYAEANGKKVRGL